MPSLELVEEIKDLLGWATDHLTGGARRIFMAKTVQILGSGGQRKAERELGWNRVTIRKGMRELESGVIQKNNFSARGRKRIEDHLPQLLADIQAVVESAARQNTTGRASRPNNPLAARQVRQGLIEEKGYTDEELPSVRTIRNKLNHLGYCSRGKIDTEPTDDNTI